MVEAEQHKAKGPSDQSLRDTEESVWCDWLPSGFQVTKCENLVDPASSHMLRSRAKPCMSQRKWFNNGSVNGSLHQQSSKW